MTQQPQPKRTNRFADELALAATLTPAVPKTEPAPRAPSRTTATADSSGFVDLSDFSETDGDWIERALAQARNGGRPIVPPSIAPVAMEAFAEPVEKRRGSSALGAIVFVAACVAIAAGGIASAVLVLRARHEKAETATAQIAAMTITAPSASADPPADTPAPTASALPAPSDSAPSTIAARPSRNGAKKPAFGSSRPQPAYAAPARTTAAAPAAKRPASGGGGGSLDDLIRKAAQSKGH
jgi:hypothetical protein